MSKKLEIGIGEKGEMWFKTTFPANGKIWVPQTIRDIIPVGIGIKVTIKKAK